MPDIAWVPLFIKAPNQQTGGPDDRPAESIDVVPTVAEHLGVRIPWKVDGRSLLGPPRRTRTFPMLDWSRNVWHPPPGTHYLHVARAAGLPDGARAPVPPRPVTPPTSASSPSVRTPA